MKNSLLNQGPGVLGAWGPGLKNTLRPALLLLLTLLLPVVRAAAQAATGTPEMADTLRQNGKIYVVVAVIAVVLAGLLFFLISLDRKLTRLEKEVKD